MLALRCFPLVVLLAAWSGRAAGGHSHGWECSDKTRCRTMDACTREDALFRTGHRCHGFPWYNGGAPLEPFDWDSEDETYECTEEVGSACVAWTTREDGDDEFEVGLGKCTEFNNDRGYCMKWRVDQSEVERCNEDGWEKGDVVKLVDGSTVRKRCCKDDCDSDGICAEVCKTREIEYEYSLCECTKAADITGNTTYCSEWKCIEHDNNGKDAAETEIYRCLKQHPTQPYCIAWEGEIDGYEEFEMASCRCEYTEGAFCAKWSCFEVGADYQRPNLDYIAFAILFGGVVHALIVGLSICFWKVCGTKKKRAVVCIVFSGLVLYGGAVCYPSALRGGVIVLLVAVLWEVLLAGCTVHYFMGGFRSVKW